MFEFEMCDNGRKIMKVFLQHVIVEISIKKSHDKIEIIKQQ